MSNEEIQNSEVTSELDNVTSDLNDLFANLDNLSEGDLQITERKAGSLASLAEELAKGGTFNPEWKFRLCKPSSESLLTWFVPTTDIKECPYEVLAVRGVPVGIFHGLSLYDSNTSNTVCHTVAIVPDKDTVYYNELGPLTQPLYNGVAYQKENTPSRDIIRMYPYGSRKFSCAECIKAGLHQQQYISKDGTVQTDKCNGSSSILIVVSHLAISKTDLTTKTRKVEWVPVQAVKDSDGNQVYKGPFVLHVSIRAGSARFPNDALTNLTPPDTKCWSKFYAELAQNDLVTDYLGHENVGHLLAPVLVEMWAGKPTDPKKYLSATVKALPGFRIANPELINTVAMQKLVAGCYEIYKKEYVAYGGKLVDGKLPAKSFNITEDEEQRALQQHIAKRVVLAISEEQSTQKAANPMALKSAAVEDNEDAVDTTTTPVSEMPVVFSRNGK
ncbi:hypothetical protein OsccyDRAFT_0725 [Leptolyngbyaceae cyanobacterium JSC-12]|nr:hypothetical protein OsccyDRAFT_0725 [Leptolyngbyaceae cyanobacterium JSC-12]